MVYVLDKELLKQQFVGSGGLVAAVGGRCRGLDGFRFRRVGGAPAIQWMRRLPHVPRCYRNCESRTSLANEIFTGRAANDAMSFEPRKLDRLLAEAIGDDLAVAAELRALFLASATAHVAALSQAADVHDWREEALRLQGLAATFGVSELIDAARAAAASAPDRHLLDAVADAIAACR